MLLARDPNKLMHTAEELRGRGTKVLALVCDVRDQRQVHDSVATILRETRRVDVLINNAGTIQVGPVENMDFKDFRKRHGRAFLGSALSHAGNYSAHEGSRWRPHCKYRFDRRQSGRAPFIAVCGE